MQVTLQEAYQEACAALGESIVRERLLTKALVAEQQKPDPPTAPDQDGGDHA